MTDTMEPAVVELDTSTQGVDGYLSIEEYRQGVYTLTAEGETEDCEPERVYVPMSLAEVRTLHAQLSALLSAVEADS